MLSRESFLPSDFAAHSTRNGDPRGLRRRLNFADLVDKHGDAKVTDDGPAFANYEKARAFSLYDRCKVRYGLCP